VQLVSARRTAPHIRSKDTILDGTLGTHPDGLEIARFESEPMAAHWTVIERMCCLRGRVDDGFVLVLGPNFLVLQAIKDTGSQLHGWSIYSCVCDCG
jgi:hypothetical protein